MENNEIINFNDFFKGKESKKSSFNKEDFYSTNEEINSDEVVKNTTISNFPHIAEEDSEKKEKNLEKSYIEDPDGMYPRNTYNDTESSDWQDGMGDPPISNENFYSVFKDKSEDFSCDIQLEGANLSETEARLILESDDWTLMFNGEIDKNGKCIIPIKKLAILNEGTTGKIRLEVIAEGSVFTPWEDEFKVKVSKKVSVVVNEGKSQAKNHPNKTGVKVNFKK
jgi:hypothetical protein